MRITLAQLEALFWIARLGSVQQAARQLNLAQPTVSLRLRDLALGVGKPLFERAKRSLPRSRSWPSLPSGLTESPRLELHSDHAETPNGARSGNGRRVSPASVRSGASGHARAYTWIRSKRSIDTSQPAPVGLHA